MSDEFEELLAKIERLPGRSSQLRTLIEHLSEIVEQVEVAYGRVDADQVRAIVREEVCSSEARTAAAISSIPPGLALNDVRGAVEVARETTILAVREIVHEALERVVAEVKASVAAVPAAPALQSAPVVAGKKLTPAEARKIVLAPVHLEIDVERRLDGRIGRFIVNER